MQLRYKKRTKNILKVRVDFGPLKNITGKSLLFFPVFMKRPLVFWHFLMVLDNCLYPPGERVALDSLVLQDDLFSQV
jgi:hypothetical protein